MDLEKVREDIRNYPPVVIALASGFLGRYREFDVDLHHLIVPPGSDVCLGLGVNVNYSFNQGIRTMLKNPDFKYVWFIGDDHVFAPNIIYEMLQRDVDILFPLVLKRSVPFQTVISTSADTGYKNVTLEDIEDWNGLLDITCLNVGNAGLLVKRHVFEKIPEPWFECGKTHPEMGGGDLYLCEKFRMYGFKMHLDTEIRLGHITHCFFYPTRNNEGKIVGDIRMTDNGVGEVI